MKKRQGLAFIIVRLAASEGAGLVLKQILIGGYLTLMWLDRVQGIVPLDLYLCVECTRCSDMWSRSSHLVSSLKVMTTAATDVHEEHLMEKNESYGVVSNVLWIGSYEQYKSVVILSADCHWSCSVCSQSSEFTLSCMIHFTSHCNILCVTHSLRCVRRKWTVVQCRVFISVLTDLEDFTIYTIDDVLVLYCTYICLLMLMTLL